MNEFTVDIKYIRSGNLLCITGIQCTGEVNDTSRPYVFVKDKRVFIQYEHETQCMCWTGQSISAVDFARINCETQENIAHMNAERKKSIVVRDVKVLSFKSEHARVYFNLYCCLRHGVDIIVLGWDTACINYDDSIPVNKLSTFFITVENDLLYVYKLVGNTRAKVLRLAISDRYEFNDFMNNYIPVIKDALNSMCIKCGAYVNQVQTAIGDLVDGEPLV